MEFEWETERKRYISDFHNLVKCYLEQLNLKEEAETFVSRISEGRFDYVSSTRNWIAARRSGKLNLDNDLNINNHVWRYLVDLRLNKVADAFPARTLNVDNSVIISSLKEWIVPPAKAPEQSPLEIAISAFHNFVTSYLLQLNLEDFAVEFDRTIKEAVVDFSQFATIKNWIMLRDSENLRSLLQEQLQINGLVSFHLQELKLHEIVKAFDERTVAVDNSEIIESLYQWTLPNPPRARLRLPPRAADRVQDEQADQHPPEPSIPEESSGGDHN